MSAIVKNTEAQEKFGKEEGSGVRCGPGYENSPYCSGNWKTLKAGYLYKRRRGHEAWAKRWVILQVGRILWTTKDTMPPKGASTIWYAKVTQGKKEKMKTSSFKKVLSFHRSARKISKQSIAFAAGASSRISTALAGSASSPTMGINRKTSNENVLSNSSSIKEALDELESDEDDAEEGKGVGNENSDATGGGGQAAEEAVVRLSAEADFFVEEGGDGDGDERFHSASGELGEPTSALVDDDENGGRVAAADSEGRLESGEGSMNESIERASLIDPATVEWKLEEMIWIRREFDGMGMDQATYHLLAGAMHWKKRFGRLDADEGSEDPSPRIIIYRDQKWPTVVKGVVNLKNATVSMSDKKTIRKRFRFTIHQEDGDSTDIATDSEEERLVWIARLKELGVHHKAPDMLREIRSKSVENMKEAGGSMAMPSGPASDASDAADAAEEPLPSGGDVNEFGRINSTVMNPDWMNEPDEILEEISDEEDEEDEPEHVFAITIEFHQRDGKDHRRLLLAADSPYEQEDWMRCLNEAVNPPADPYHSNVKPTSTFYQSQRNMGDGKGALFFAGGGIVNAAGSSGAVEIRPHWED